MDLSWNFRSSFDKARVIKENQDEWCEKAIGSFPSSSSSRSISSWNWWGRSGAKEPKDGGLALREALGKFPEELEWEMLVDVLRGKVKVNTHCYEVRFSAYSGKFAMSQQMLTKCWCVVLVNRSSSFRSSYSRVQISVGRGTSLKPLIFS